MLLAGRLSSYLCTKHTKSELWGCRDHILMLESHCILWQAAATMSSHYKDTLQVFSAIAGA